MWVRCVNTEPEKLKFKLPCVRIIRDYQQKKRFDVTLRAVLQRYHLKLAC